MQKIILILVGCWVGLSSCGQDTVKSITPIETRISHLLGDSVIEIVTLQYGDRPDIVMLNLHDDERTSVEAAKLVLEKSGGYLVRLENDSQRLISFNVDGKVVKFDPNRMFSVQGIRATLEKHNKTYNPKVIPLIQRFAGFVIENIPGKPTTLIALHNNDPGRLTIHSYARGGDLAKEVAAYASSREAEADDFFFTTDKSLYKALSKQGFNIVFQDNRRATDDGSLSVYYGRRKKSYINVEAGIGRIREQEAMLLAVLEHISKNEDN